MADLHKQFSQIIALMRSTTFTGERDAAERKARQIAVKLGLSFEQALHDLGLSPRAEPSAGDMARRQTEENRRKAQEDLCQAQSAHQRHQRGREAREAAERLARAKQDARRRQEDERRRREETERRQREAAERSQREEQAERLRREREHNRREEDARRRRVQAEHRRRRASVIARYGHSKDDVFKPTPREAMILAAVAQWRKLTDNKRWTQSLDGWSDDMGSAPAHVAAAVRQAYPMPTTYQDARDELNDWDRRYDDLCVMLNLDTKGYDEDSLDLPFRVRYSLVESLVLHEMCLTSLPDMIDRMRRARVYDAFDRQVEDALLRDLERLAQQSSVQEEGSTQATPTLDARVLAALKQDISRSNRAIAREVGCSPTVVGRVRKKAGLDADIQIVRRKDQIYEMRGKRNRASG